MTPVPWREATARALYGPDGFYVRESPAAHFRTSATASSLLAEAVHALACEVDRQLDEPDPFSLVDLGAGGGELLRAVARCGVPERWRLVGVDLRARPGGLPAAVGWATRPPAEVSGVLVAHEYLDDVPVDVVSRDADGLRLVLVDPATGEESPGGPPSARDVAWLDRWWPLRSGRLGERAEPGHPRDDAWAAAVAALQRGVAVAVDYATDGHGRRTGRWPAGTLAGYRAGQRVRPVPDGSCDVTAHVALDACAEAGRRSGATATLLATQRDVLGALGVDGRTPDPAVARRDPAGYLAALQRAGSAAELRDPDGLGAFGWLVQGVGCPVPPSLAALARSSP